MASRERINAMANPFAVARRISAISGPISDGFDRKGLTLQMIQDNFYPTSAAPTLATTREGLGSNVVMAPVFWIMRTFTEAQLVIQKRLETDVGRRLWENVPDHELEMLADRPNPYYNGNALWKATLISYVLSGNGYWLKIRNAFGAVVQLWYVPHWCMEPRWPFGGSQFISHYDYTPDHGTPFAVSPADVVHFRFGLDPENTRKGVSPIRPLLREIWTDDQCAQFSEAIVRNMGVPGLVLSPKNDGWKPSEEHKKELEAYLNSAHTGDRRGKAMVMRVPTDLHQFGFDPNKLMLASLRDISEERVCAILGIPAAVVGFGSGLQSTKVGAPQPLSARLWTPDGPTTMGAVRVGDPVATPDGWQPIEAVYPQGEQDIYRVTFQDGAWAECTADHLWRVKPPKADWQDRTLGEIAKWPWWKLRRTVLPLQGVTEFIERPVVIPPYVMGLLLADGCLGPRNLQFTSVKPDVVERIEEEVGAGYAVNQTVDGGIDYRIAYRDAARGRGIGGGTGARNPFKDELRRLGLWGHKAHEKFIPDDYKYTSASARRQLLQGLLDGDGFVNLHGQPAIEQSSARLADDITEVVQSLGGYTLGSTKRANRAFRFIKGRAFRSKHDRVHLSIVIADGASLFATPAKRDRCRARGKAPTRKFRSIEFVRREQAQCIRLPGSLYLTDGFLVTHNTMRELRRLAWVQCLTPMQKDLAKEVTTQLLPDFQSQLRRFRAWFDTSEISSFPEDDNLRAERVRGLVRDGVLRVDRAQAMLGLEVDDTQKVYLRPTTTQSVDENGNILPPAPIVEHVQGHPNGEQLPADVTDSADAAADDTPPAVAARMNGNGAHT